MARLPTADALGSRATPRPAGGIVSYETGSVGRATEQLANALTVAGERVDKKNDEQAVFEARRKLDEWERTTLYDPENGVVAKRGADALDLPNKITADYDKFAGQVTQGLTSNRQREVFQDMAQSRRNQVADFTVRHAVQQKEVYEKGQVNADLIASADRSTLLATNGDLGGSKAELDVANGRLTSFMTQRGASGEEIAGAIKENSSKVHTSVVQAMVNKGDATGAKTYLDANAGAMLQQDVTRAGGLLKEGLLRQKAQAFGDEVMSQGLDLKDALAKARDKFTGDDEVAATNEVKTRFAERETALTIQHKENADTAWKVITNGGSRNQIPAQVWDKLGGEEQRQINDYIEQKWRRAKADAKGDEVDPQAYYGLRMMASENPDAFAKLDLTKSAPLISAKHMDHLTEIQAGINKGDLKLMQSQQVMKSTIGMLKNEIAAAGIDLTLTDKDKGTEKAKNTTAFLGVVQQSLDEATATKGSPLTAAEARNIGMGLLREGVEQGSGLFGMFQTKKRGYQIATDPNIKPGTNFVAASFGDIPPAVRDALVRDYRATKGGSTRALTTQDEQAIERAYTRGVQQGRFR
jgi:hypothetical protein